MNRALAADVRIGSKYEVIGLLGAGASGSVYRAIQHPVDRTVAVKVLDEVQMRSPRHRQRFRREAFVLGRIDHPNVITLYDYGEHDGQFHLVTEFAVGRSLQSVIESEAPMDPARVVNLGLQILDALQAVHDAGFIHRDVKPANLMVMTDSSGEEFVKLLDFGVAASLGHPAQMAEQVGTPRYMAPEQMIPGAANPRSDLFALAATLYEMLSGEQALPHREIPTLLAGTPDLPPARLSALLELPEGLESLLLAAMESNPAHRPTSAASMAAALADSLPDGTLAAPVKRRSPTGSIRVMGAERRPPETGTAEIEPRVHPLAATVTHVGRTRLPATSGPWPILDFVSDGEPQNWRADCRGSGALPLLVRKSTAQLKVVRPEAAESVADARTTSPPKPAQRPVVTSARTDWVAPACSERPCYSRRCFWAVLTINAAVLGIISFL